jgi:hypothetical protein
MPHSSSVSLIKPSLGSSKSISIFSESHLPPKRIQLAMNKKNKGSNVGKMATGVVDLPTKGKDQNFFSTIKPLVEGCCFMIETNSRQLVLQQVFLDLNLLMIHIHNCNGLSKETICVDKIVKTELPAATLE